MNDPSCTHRSTMHRAQSERKKRHNYSLENYPRKEPTSGVRTYEEIQSKQLQCRFHISTSSTHKQRQGTTRPSRMTTTYGTASTQRRQFVSLTLLLYISRLLAVQSREGTSQPCNVYISLQNCIPQTIRNALKEADKTHAHSL